jgi:hypothetical protein
MKLQISKFKLLNLISVNSENFSIDRIRPNEQNIETTSLSLAYEGMPTTRTTTGYDDDDDEEVDDVGVLRGVGRTPDRGVVPGVVDGVTVSTLS